MAQETEFPGHSLKCLSALPSALPHGPGSRTEAVSLPDKLLLSVLFSLTDRKAKQHASAPWSLPPVLLLVLPRGAGAQVLVWQASCTPCFAPGASVDSLACGASFGAERQLGSGSLVVLFHTESSAHSRHCLSPAVHQTRSSFISYPHRGVSRLFSTPLLSACLG